MESYLAIPGCSNRQRNVIEYVNKLNDDDSSAYLVNNVVMQLGMDNISNVTTDPFKDCL